MMARQLSVLIILGMLLAPASTWSAGESGTQAQPGLAEQAAAQAPSAAAESSASEPKAFTQDPWQHPPVIRITKWGEELQLEVQPNELMEKEQILDIDSVALQTEQGDLLGFKSFDPQTSDRRAEFLINPKALKLETLKIEVHGRRLNEWSSLTSLKVTEPAPASAVPDPVKETPAADIPSGATAASADSAQVQELPAKP